MGIFDIYLLEAVINGLLLGGVLALLSLGLNLIFGVIDVVWICYAELIMLGMYGMYFLYTVYHAPIAAAAVVCIVGVGVLGLLPRSSAPRRSTSSWPPAESSSSCSPPRPSCSGSSSRTSGCGCRC